MESINKPGLVREHNLAILRRTLFSARQATRQELSRRTGISTVTLGGLLQELVRSGDALELETSQPASGRPAQVYAFNPRLRLGLTLFAQSIPNGFSFSAALLDMYGQALYKEEITEDLADENATYRLLCRLTANRPVAAVAIGLPGIGLREYFCGHHASKLLSISGVQRFSAETHIPVDLENDVNLAALGYAEAAGLPDSASMAYLYLFARCYGGSAIYLSGRLHTGKDRFAGEMHPDILGVDWSQMDTADAEAICSGLLKTARPYISILAPDQIVIASDYITEAQLAAVQARLLARFGERACPRLFLSHGFQADYMRGIGQLVLQKITDFEKGATYDEQEAGRKP